MPRMNAVSRLTLSQVLRAGLFLGGSVLAATVFLLAHWAISRLTLEVATTSRLLAQFCAQASYPATNDAEMNALVSRVIAGIDFPIVLTDRGGLPRAWRGVEVDADLVSADALDSLQLGLPIAPVTAARVGRVRRRVPELDEHNPPIAMTRSVFPDTIGWVHYGEPRVLELLRWTPYVSLGGTVLLLGLGFWGLAAIRQAEKRAIWVGMAKETAHQLGTPLSSLMGWNDLLRSHLRGASGDAPLPASELAEAVSEMERDVQRLRRVAERFSNVGSEPNLQPGDPTPIVREAVSYMRRRVPTSGRAVQLEENYAPVPVVRLNAELLAWALENLIANALTALDKEPGMIEVAVRPVPDGRRVEITVTDNGRGMGPREQRRAFEPGYTTRRRGWGLGLPLARRVVADAHGGRIWIRSSVPGRGTTMAIQLPVAT